MRMSDSCTDPRCITCNPYPYTHHGPAVHGSKLADYLISEARLRIDHPELFDGTEVTAPISPQGQAPQ